MQFPQSPRAKHSPHVRDICHKVLFFRYPFAEKIHAVGPPEIMDPWAVAGMGYADLVKIPAEVIFVCRADISSYDSGYD